MRLALQEYLATVGLANWRLNNDSASRLGQFYAHVLKDDDARIFVAVDLQDRPQAMLTVRVVHASYMAIGKYGRIEDAWVEPPYRQQGVMTTLTRAGCRFLAERGVREVTLDWVNANRPGARCWQRLGFRPLMTIGFASPVTLLAANYQRTTPGAAGH